MGFENLNLLDLHSNLDKDPRSWIIATGLDLPCEVGKLIKEIDYSRCDLINLILKKNEIKIHFSSLGCSLGETIKNRLCSIKINNDKAAKIFKMSGRSLSKLFSGNYFPSCSKLKRMERTIGKIGYFECGCNKKDFCVKRADIIIKSIFNDFKEYPLFLISDLLEIWSSNRNVDKELFLNRKYSIINCISSLRCNQHFSSPIKACKFLNYNLSKVLGAFCADGSQSQSYLIRWEEEHHSNLVALSKWIKRCFKEVDVKYAKRGRNSYVLKFRNKIIGRYFTNIFGIPTGYKTHKIHMPKIIKNSNFEIRKEFTKGFMTFEAGANSSGSISLSVRSKRMRDDVALVLEEDQVNINIFETEKDGLFYCFATNENNNPLQKKKFVSYFEKNTIKWLKMKEFQNGFSQKVKDENAALKILAVFFYKNQNIDICKIYKVCKAFRSFTIYEIIQNTDYDRGTLSKYLTFLCKTNMLKKIRRKKSVYTFNKDIKTWVLPSLKYYQTLKI